MAAKIAMQVTELDSFIDKFKSLWNAGLEAHLDIDTQAGQAWVGLRLSLGHPPGPHHQLPPHIQRNSPSRQRRRERRAAARKESAEKVAQKQTAEEVVEKDATRTVNVAEKVAASPNNNEGDKAAEAISLEFNCEQCDEHFESVNELRIHEGKVHCVIPQMDGQGEELFEENEG